MKSANMKSINRAGAGHCGAAAEPHKPALADGRVAEADGSVKIEEPGRGLEIAAALADAFAHDEDRRVTGHLLRQGLERGLHVRDLARYRCRRPLPFRIESWQNRGEHEMNQVHRIRTERPFRVRATGWLRRIAGHRRRSSQLSVSMASSSPAATAWASTIEARSRAIGQRLFQLSTSSRVR